MSFYKENFGRGEYLFQDGDALTRLSIVFPDAVLPNSLPDINPFDLLYGHFAKIEPYGAYDYNEAHVQLLKDWRNQGILVAVLSDAAEFLSRKVLKINGFIPERDFDIYRPWILNTSGPPKYLSRGEAFLEMVRQLNLPPHKILAIGDSFANDLGAALELGCKACLVGESPSGLIPVVSDISALSLFPDKSFA